MSRRAIAGTVFGAFAIVAAAHLRSQLVAPESAFTAHDQRVLQAQ